MNQQTNSYSPVQCDLLIINARIITGDCSPAFDGMVGISKERICYVGTVRPYSCDTVIDAQGKILSPGFIDIHGHSDFTILLYPDAESKVAQGVTTEFIGNCGLSAAPLYGDAWKRWHSRWEKKNLTVDWHTPEEYFRRLEQRKSNINIAPLLGHGNLRASIKSYNGQLLSNDEKKEFALLAENSVRCGFWGISLGLAYPPGIFSDESELAILFQLAQEKRIPITVHMRNEGDTVEESVDEMLDLAQRYGTQLQISHLKAYGSKNGEKIKRIIEKIDYIREHKKLDVCFDRYPYTAFNTDLDFILPQEIFDGGHACALSKLRQPAFRTMLGKQLAAQYTLDDASNIVISSIRSDKQKLIGKRLTDVFDPADPNFWEHVVALIDEVECEAEATFILMKEDNLPILFVHPCAIVASDSSVRPYNDSGNPHPRTYGTFPRFLEMVLNSNLMPIEQAVYKITGLPARKFGLDNRGVIKEQYYADLVLWNPHTIADMSSYENSKIKPHGICAVWVNGHMVYKEGNVFEQLSGKLLLKHQRGAD